MREDEHEQFVVVINFSSRPVTAGTEVSNPADFQLMKIKGLTGSPAVDFPAMQLGGYEWRIYHRIIPPISAASARPVSVQ
jgi:hypothetical protein